MYDAKHTALPQFNSSTESQEIGAQAGKSNFSTLIMVSTLLIPGHNLRKVTNPPYC